MNQRQAVHTRLQEAGAAGPRADVRAVLEALADVFIQYDADGRILWCNRQLCNLMECQEADLVGKALPKLGIDVPPVSGTEPSRCVEGAVQTAQGVRWFSWKHISIDCDVSGETCHFAVARDITPIKQREAALSEARELAEQASLAKSRMLATVSHEMRTPMNGVIGMAGLLAFTPLTPEQQTYVQAISTSAEALIKIVNELLDYARIEAGQLVLDPQRVQIRELIEGVVELLAVNAFDKDLGIASHVAPDVPDSFMADPVRLRQVLLNLVGNAIKLTAQGGVLVTAACPAPDRIEFTVRDTGPGMDVDTVARLFTEFGQSRERAARPEEGTGLGLAITRRLIVAMGGDITVETTPGQGTSFTVSLPLTDAEPSSEKADAFSGLDVAILTPRVVEAQALAMAVEARGGRAFVLDGEDAVASIIRSGHGQVDVLIADACLEGSDGHLLERLRAEGLEARLWLTLIAPKDRAGLPMLRAAGYNAFIARPARGSTVVRLVSGELPTSPMQPSAQKTQLRSTLVARDFHVLLAEDNRINALLTERVLTSAGCKVTTVIRGSDALDALERQLGQFELVIVDLCLPDLCGFELIDRIRSCEQREERRAVPILVLSADGREETRQRALSAGATEFFHKPLDPADLLSLIAKIGET